MENGNNGNVYNFGCRYCAKEENGEIPVKVVLPKKYYQTIYEDSLESGVVLGDIFKRIIESYYEIGFIEMHSDEYRNS